MVQEVPWVRVALVVQVDLEVRGDLADRADLACLGVPEDLEDPVVQMDLEALVVPEDLEVLVVQEDLAARDVKRREGHLGSENVAQKLSIGPQNIHIIPMETPSPYQLVHLK